MVRVAASLKNRLVSANLIARRLASAAPTEHRGAPSSTAKHGFFSNQGEFRSGNYFEIMKKASCLRLLFNAIPVRNTVRIGNILRNAKESESKFPPEAVSRASPLYHGHVVDNGVHDFPSAIPRRSEVNYV
jgi:TnpA family transposase